MVLPSSSSRREATTEIHHAKAIGCMSGIFQLISKYHTRRKFLTFGKKHEKNSAASSPSNSNIKLQSATFTETDDVKIKTNTNSKFNYEVEEPECHVTRSRTLPADIQSSVSAIKPPATEGVTMAEKRVMLLGALQRCDDDLKSLRKIIESLKSVQTSPLPVDEADVVYKAEKRILLEKIDDNKCSSFNSEQQPSPVSVLDEFARSPPVSSCLRRQNNEGGTMQQQRSKTPGEEETMKTVRIIFCNNNNKTPPVERYYTNNKAEKAAAAARPARGSNAMAESVERACKDIACGEKREVGRIGLALQDHICRDLIQEMVLEMGFHFPASSCRRRLRF